jgi:FlaA1/EpsC-like NDP-sugar epimerase
VAINNLIITIFKDKILLITGETGSFGNAVLRRFLNSDIKEIRIFSRDEKKQDDMCHRLQNPKVKFYRGDVRNLTTERLEALDAGIVTLVVTDYGKIISEVSKFFDDSGC